MQSKVFIWVFGFLSLALPLSAIDRYVDTTGSDTLNDCSVLVAPCLTVQHAIDQSLSGDVIHVASGTYSVIGLTTINKTLTLLGAQSGVDARTRVGAETVLSNSQGISVAGDNVVIDGFTIEGSSNNAFTGYGVWINPGKNGTRIVNNIVQNNIVGLGLANGGLTQALIEHNLFQNNNLAGSSSGTAIYTDEFSGGTVANVLINENKFYNNQNAGIGFSSTDAVNPSSDITITGNTFDTNGRGMYFLNAVDITVMNNTITNTTLPTDGGASSALTAFGGVVNLAVTRNHFQTGQQYAIRIRNLLSGEPPPPNMNITIHLNNFIGFGVAALHVDDPFQTPLDFAICNWWNSASGPTNAIENPLGTGEIVSGFIVNANFNNWLMGTGPDAPCGITGMVGIDLDFHPHEICVDKKATLILTLENYGNSEVMIISFVDDLPPGLRVKGLPQTNCQGMISVSNSGSTITLTGGTIGAAGSCTIRAKVTADNDGEYINTLGIGALETDHGINMNEASDELNVLEEDEGHCHNSQDRDRPVHEIPPSSGPPQDHAIGEGFAPSVSLAPEQGEPGVLPTDQPTAEGCTNASFTYGYLLWFMTLLVAIRKLYVRIN